MKFLKSMVVICAAILLTVLSSASRAQGWTTGGYSVSAYIKQVATGSGSYYTIGVGPTAGKCQAGVGGTTSGEGWGSATFAVTYTFTGMGSPTSITITPYGAYTGGATPLPASAIATSNASTTDAGGYSDSGAAPPTYNSQTHGGGLGYSSSPFTLYFSASAHATYLGTASAQCATTVWFQ